MASFLLGLSSFLFGVACIGLSWALGTKILEDTTTIKTTKYNDDDDATSLYQPFSFE